MTRHSMLDTIDRHVRETADETGLSALPERVRQALLAVDRSAFLPRAERALAWADTPLPIGHDQTISQPFIVALMTALVNPGPEARVLEVGSGCGYQAAVLAELAARVTAIEIVAPLAEAARERLRTLGYDNVTVRCRDGNTGAPEDAPFDGILVTCACPRVPPALQEQLAVGGRLVLPLNDTAGAQTLTMITRQNDGTCTQQPLLPVRFVPLTGATGAS